jgi:ketosteroid isomerase-like protein
MAEAEAEIRRLIDGRIAAMRAKDAAAAVACLADDVVAFELAPPLALPSGAARDVAGFAAWLSAFEEIDVEVGDLRIEAAGEVGFAYALHHLTGTRAGGHKVDLCARRFAFGARPTGGASPMPIPRCPSTWTGPSARPWICSPRASLSRL